MITQATLDQLMKMKLHGMARSFQQHLSSKTSDALTFEERFSMMVDLEWSERENRKLKTRLSKSKLREFASAEDIDYRHPRGLDRSVVQRLLECQWIRNRENIILTGTSGLGKTWLACAFAHKACREGYSTLYMRVPRLLQDLMLARGTGTYPKLMDRLARPDVLILDDFGLAPLSDCERRDLLEVVEDRHARRSTVVTSQLPVKHWHDLIGEPTIADALLDRLIASSHRIELAGKDTMRGTTRNKKEHSESKKVI